MIWRLPTAVECFESYSLKVPKGILIIEATEDDELYTRQLKPPNFQLPIYVLYMD